MRYFSYNDYMDSTENGEINEIIKVEENIAKYELKNGTKTTYNAKNKFIKMLKNKVYLKKFLEVFLNLSEIGGIENIAYYNNIKSITDKPNNIVCKIQNREIFILIKVINNIDTNITYKMFEHSLNII